MIKFLLLQVLALLLFACSSSISSAPQPILSAPGEYKVDKCPDQQPILHTDEKALTAVIGEDTKTIGCLRGELVLWIKWNEQREAKLQEK